MMHGADGLIFKFSLFRSLTRLPLSSDYKFTHISSMKLTLQSEGMLTIWLSNHTWLKMERGTEQKLISVSIQIIKACCICSVDRNKIIREGY